MNKRSLVFRISSVVISLVLIAAMALCMASCGKTETPSDTSSVAAVENAAVKTEFKFSVTDADGNKKDYNLSTEKKMLGEALLEAGIITESEQETGFINTVNGVTLNWDTDKAYWALYVGDAYAEKGVNETEITAGGEYSFVYTKG